MHHLIETSRDVYVFGAFAAGGATLFISLVVALYPYIGEAYARVVAPLIGAG